MSDSPFKMTGHTLPGPNQSPLSKVDDAGKWIKTKHQKKLIRHYDEHKDDPSFQKALTSAFGGATTYDSKTGKVLITKS